MPTAPAGVEESETRQLPERGMGENETAKRKDIIGVKKEPKSESLYEKKRIRGEQKERPGKYLMVGQ